MFFSRYCLTFIFIGFVFLGCGHQDDPDPTYPQTYGKIKIIWRTPFKDDQLYGSIAPAIFEDKVVFSNFPAFGTETFLALNADDGKTQYWTWDDYITLPSNTNGSRLPMTSNNILCLAPGNGLIGVDMRTGQTIWKNRFSSPGGNYRFGKSLIRELSQIDENTVGINMVDMETGTGRTIFKIDTISTPFAGFHSHIAQVNANGDTILYFGFYELFQQPNASLQSYSKLYAYNLTSQSILWEKNGISPSLLVRNDYLYALYDKVYCFNRHTGEVIWEQAIPEKSGGHFQIFDDKIIITDQGSNSFIHAYSLADGTPLWKHPFNGNTSEPLYYKGIMYFTCGSDGLLWAIRVSDGELIWKERCPDADIVSGSYWSFGINADPVRDKLYVASFSGAFCIEPAN